MAQQTRKAKARLTDLDTKAVSAVDRPANGEPFVIQKAETPPSTDPQVAAQEGAEPPPPSAPPPSVPPAAVLAMPTAAKAGMVSAIQTAQARLGDLLETVTGAEEAEDAEVPSDPLMALTDIAMALAQCVEPYIGKAFGGTSAGDVTEDGTVQKAAGWSQEYVDSLSDSCFLYVEPGTARDNEYRTTPLTNRHFPIRDHAYRLHLPAVLEAVAQIVETSAVWLSEPRKRSLLLSLASDRLYEATIPVWREGEQVSPEVAAELTAVAELITSVATMIGSAAPTDAPATMTDPAAPPPAEGAAPVAAAAPAESAPPMTTASVAKSFADHLEAIRKAAVAKMDAGASGTGDRGMSLFKAVQGACDHLVKAMSEYSSDPASTPIQDAACAAPPAASDAPAPSPEQKSVDVGATVAKAVADAVEPLKKSLGTLTAENDKLRLDLTATKARVAKAERASAPSGQVPVDQDTPAPVRKSDSATVLPATTDMADHWLRESQSQHPAQTTTTR